MIIKVIKLLFLLVLTLFGTIIGDDYSNGIFIMNIIALVILGISIIINILLCLPLLSLIKEGLKGTIYSILGIIAVLIPDGIPFYFLISSMIKNKIYGGNGQITAIICCISAIMMIINEIILAGGNTIYAKYNVSKKHEYKNDDNYSKDKFDTSDYEEGEFESSDYEYDSELDEDDDFTLTDEDFASDD